MLYLNQRDYRHIPYYHNLSEGGVPEDRRSVASSGCGLCCVSMMIEHLTTQTLPIEECVKLSERCGANQWIGTRMRIMGPFIADMYGLEYAQGKDVQKVIACLQNGGEVIINVGGDHDDHVGLFSHKGHYILAIATDGEEFCILDPSYRLGKYDEEALKGKARVQYPFVYCSIADLVADVQNREVPFYMFRRKTGK